ncbi:recombinase family protein [Bradyrhizobium monzae]|uniref:recombinase family protein n=1 Tax=Bradyrhizobium sp. Oc8 TaxID=2876780 RepID=UPI001F1C7B8E|nr:recombinase family protein [Bradyrhizobium sp. Oc8]
MSHHLASEVDGPIRAAQYLRMSSENQRYSTENQRDAIAEYAQHHGFSIVATYIDAGKSGLSLKGRGALKQLLSDALAAKRNFDVVLVLDVSRWGRFQDPDQAAHYEFLCREAGVRIVYCAEPFGDDITPSTTIVKHLKRVMAGEYSRDLSVKLARAHLQQARLGFRQGGSLLYGFRRLLVDADRNPKQLLNSGDKKALSDDKVIVVPGPSEELDVIRRIFSLFVQRRLTATEIAQRFANEGVKGIGGGPLSAVTIRHILSSELCIGKMTYNLSTSRLQGRTSKNPEALWVRFSAFEPIVSLSQFRKAQELRQAANRRWSKETLTKKLQSLLAKEGHLSQKILNNSAGAPAAETVVSHFGSLKAAYAAIGYDPPDIPPFGNNGKHWSKQAVLIGLRKLYAANGYISNRLIDGFSELPSQCHIRRHFGSIAQAMKQAGVPLSSHSERQRYSWKRRKASGCDDYFHGVRWTNTQLLRALRRLHRGYGYISADLLDWNGASPTAYYYIKRFGSLTKARRLAKLPVPTHSQIMAAALKRKKEGTKIERPASGHVGRSSLRYRSEKILAGLQRLAKRKRMISARLIDEDASLPSSATVVCHFGSLSAAYKLAGLGSVPING